jgi:hypothetical protein
MPKWFIGPNVWSDKVMTATEAAYVAGFVDGEGTISVIKAKRRGNRAGYRLQPYFVIPNTNTEVLDAIIAMCGNGRLLQQTNPLLPTHKTLYSIRFSPNQIRHLLPQLMPYLIVKSKQAAYLMEFLGINTVGKRVFGEKQDRLDEICTAVRGLNQRGVVVPEAVN